MPAFFLPPETADYLFAPIELPLPDTDLDTFLSECHRRINWLVCEAWSSGALPERTRLVQCLTKVPVRRHVDFRHPWILRRKDFEAPDQREHRLRLLASFGHTQWHLQRRKASSHGRMRDLGDTTRGAIVIFTKQAPQGWPRDSSHILHFGFPETDWRPHPFADCVPLLETGNYDCSSELGRFAGEFEGFSATRFLDDAAKEKLRSIIDDEPAPAAWAGFSAAALRAATPDNVTGTLFEDIRKDRAYQDRVAVLLQCGTIVLSAPQSFAFSDGTKPHASNEILDSGLTVIFDGEAPPSADDLHRIQAVAHKISRLIGSTYGIAGRLANESQIVAARNIVSMIGHSLRNTFSKADRTEEQIERLVRIEALKLQAASVLFDPELQLDKAVNWDRDGYAQESIAKTVQEGLFQGSRAISIKWDALTGKKLDARFVALLFELAHNVKTHPRSGSIEVLAAKGAPGHFDVTVKTQAAAGDVEKLWGRLSTHFIWKKGRVLGGWNFILMLVQPLATSGTDVFSISFTTKEGQPVLKATGRIEETGRNEERELHIIQQSVPHTIPSNMNLTIRFSSVLAAKS